MSKILDDIKSKSRKRSNELKVVNFSLTEKTDFLLEQMALLDYDEAIDSRPNKSGLVKQLILKEARERGIID